MGVLGAGLEALRHSPRQGDKNHYQNWRYIIPYQTYILRFISIRTNQCILMHASRGVFYYRGAT